MVFALDEKQAKYYTDMALTEHLKLPALFLCYSGKNETEIENYQTLLKPRREFRDGLLLKALLDCLHPLIAAHNFKAAEVMSLLQKAFVGNIKANLLGIHGTLYCGGEEELAKEAITSNPDLNRAYQAAFTKTIPLRPIQDFSTKHERTFGRCALPTAIITYAGRFHPLPVNEQEKILMTLESFVHSVLEGEFPKVRYDKSNHLRKIFEARPNLTEGWPTEVESPLEKYLPAESSNTSFDPQCFLMDKILKDEHLPPEKYPLLYRFLKTKDAVIAKELSETLKKRAASLKEITRQKVNLRNAISSLEDKEKSVKLPDVLIKAKQQFAAIPGMDKSLCEIEHSASPDVEQLQKILKSALAQLSADDEEHQAILLQKDLMDLYLNPDVPLSQKLNQLVKIQGKLSQSRYEFLNDINGVIEALRKQKQSFENYTLANTDRFDLMLLCGTQVQGSCQRIDGDPKLNKCLLAYLLDGKIRLLAIKDKKGNIVARSIFRLLWDAENQRPALMQERIYTNILDDGLKAALDQFALAESKRLGAALYRADGEGDVVLESFGSVAPWEYVDSAKGVQANGKYTITKASLVWQP